MRMLLACLLALLTVAPSAFAQTVARSIEVDGQRRSFLLHAPPGEGLRPMVMMFHGAGSSARQMERSSGWSELADVENVIVVYPQAQNGRWRALSGGEDDIVFAAAIVQTLAGEGLIDRNRVYGGGISLGAQITWRIACRRPHLFASVGLVSGGYLQVCRPERPAAVIFHGQRDQILPYDGRGDLMPVLDFARGWGSEGCAQVATGVREAERYNTQFWSCENRRAVLYTFPRAGHVYFRQDRDGLDATAAMWRFFIETR